ncbi:MAG: hypothetical protein LBF27_24345 [Sphingobacterium sp.]|nr:hypothetical protein [Sphingobacterium sp.]
MKRVLTFASILLLIMGCSKNEIEQVEKPAIEIEKDIFEYLNTDLSGEVAVTSNVEWEMAQMGGEDWMTANRKDGNIGIAMKENNSVNERTAKIILTSKNGKIKKVAVVKQHGNKPTLLVDKATFALDNKESQLEVKISSNMEWSAQSNVSWCTVERDGNNIKISVQPNTQFASRTASIAVSGELPVADKKITITQKGSVDFEVDKRSLTLTRLGEAQEVIVTTGLEWSFSTTATWLKIEKNGNKLRISAPENVLLERMATLVLTTNNLNVNIAIRQAGRTFGNELDREVLIALYTNMGGANSGTDWDITKPLNASTLSSAWSGITLTTINGASRVTAINLIGKKLAGKIPAEIGYLTELTELQLSNNYTIEGTLPASIGTLSKLKTLTCSRNQISGSIPAEFANLKELTIFQIHTNKLSGTLPANVFGQLTKLNSLELKLNNLTGAIPQDMKDNPKWASWNGAVNICPQNPGFGFSNCP